MKYDVVVVGAGPAGSTAAKFLAEKGFSVALVDKSKFPRHKPCGGGLPSHVFKRFPYIKDMDVIESYSLGGFAYSAKLNYKAKVQKKEPIVGMVRREKFDSALAKLAADSGAELIEGKAVEDIKISKSKAKIKLDDKTELDSKIVVGADGIWSAIAKKTGLMPPKRRVGMCVYNEYALDEETIKNLYGAEKMCHLHVKFKGILGYGWVFPKKEHVNIGIGMIVPKVYSPDNKVNLLDAYREYFDTLKQTKLIPDALEIGKCTGGALPYFPLKKTYADRLLLVGDAAGFVNPLTGEGIYYAMASGELASGIINESLEANDTSEEFLSKYQEVWKEDFGLDLEMLQGATGQMGDDSERVVKLASKDKKLSDIALGMLHGELSIRKNKGRLIRRYLYVSFKDKLGLLR